MFLRPASCRDRRLLFAMLLWCTALHAAGSLGMSVADSADGVTVTAVHAQGPAARAGVQVGDVILALQAQAVTSAAQLAMAVRASPAQDALELKISRAGWTRTIRLLPDGPSAPAVQGTAASAEQGEWEQRADRHAYAGQFSDAVAAYQKALAAGPPRASIYHGLGWNYYNLGRYEEADDAFRRALELDPGNANTLLTMGTTQMQLGRTEAAQDCWQKASALDPQGEIGNIARTNLAKTAYNTQLKGGGGSVAGRSDGLKAIVAVGDFQVKAAKATAEIGDGLREMLHTALHNSGYFIVVERMDLKGLAAEQTLSHSRMARPESALPESRMDIAEIMVYAAVTEFEPQAKSANWVNVMPRMPLAISQNYNESHMALDMRVVDVASGRVLATQRIPGLAIAMRASLSTVIPGTPLGIPVGLSMYRNTPMELAIRDCIQKAVMYVINNSPEDYFRHR
ncbi:MAG: CsgG/HfaB family protein [Sulfuricella sp.]